MSKPIATPAAIERRKNNHRFIGVIVPQTGGLDKDESESLEKRLIRRIKSCTIN